MVSTFFILFLFIVSITSLLGLFFFKAGVQLQYLRVRNRKPAGLWTDVFLFTDKVDREERNAAFMLFPLLFPIELDEKKEELNQIKRKIKKIHIGLYLCIMIIFSLGAYTSVTYPQGLF